MRPFLEEHFGNPSSGHWATLQAKAALAEARGQVAALLGAESDEIVFTSGASEQDHHEQAIRRAEGAVRRRCPHPRKQAPCGAVGVHAGEPAAMP